MTYISNSIDETEALGKLLGETVLSHEENCFIAMFGDLGAGKTVFVRGLASILSPGSRVKSPTYTLVNEYRKGVKPLFHFDLYRIGNSDDLEGFGFYDYIKSGNCVSEWSENLGGNLPEGAISVTIEKNGNDSRIITIEGIELEGNI